jgi:hypothetical protein
VIKLNQINGKSCVKISDDKSKVGLKQVLSRLHLPGLG